MAFQEDKFALSRERIISTIQSFADDTDDVLLEHLHDVLLAVIWNEMETMYPMIPSMNFLELKQHLVRKGFEFLSDECVFIKFFRKDGHLFSLNLKNQPVSLRVFIGNSYSVNVNNTNPMLMADALTTFFSQMKELPERFYDCVKEGRNRAVASKIAFPYLSAKAENSHILDGYEHSFEFNFGDTVLLISNFLDTDKDGHSWYELTLTMENFDEVMSKLPRALADFEQFEFIFPKAPLCWSKY